MVDFSRIKTLKGLQSPLVNILAFPEPTKTRQPARHHLMRTRSVWLKSPRAESGGGCCPHPLFIFNDRTFVLQILFCTPQDPQPRCRPSPIHLSARSLGIGKVWRLSRLRILLKDPFCLREFFYGWLSVFSFFLPPPKPGLYFGRGREKRNRKEMTTFVFF